MSKKVYNLIVGIIGGVELIAISVVTFSVKNTGLAVAIDGAIKIAGTAAIEICNQFVKETEKKEIK